MEKEMFSEVADANSIFKQLITEKGFTDAAKF